MRFTLMLQTDLLLLFLAFRTYRTWIGVVFKIYLIATRQVLIEFVFPIMLVDTFPFLPSIYPSTIFKLRTTSSLLFRYEALVVKLE